MVSKQLWVLFVLSLSFLTVVSGNPVSKKYFSSLRKQRRDADEPLDNDIGNSNGGTEEFRESDVTDLADLEIMLSRAQHDYKVVIFRGVPRLKINDSFAETNEGIRRLLVFISKAKLHAGGQGFSSTSSHESEGFSTRQMENTRSQVAKKENRYEISYWNYHHQQEPGIHEILEKYEVRVMCQANPPGHTLAVNGHPIVSGSKVWQLTVNEACRFWRA